MTAIAAAVMPKRTSGRSRWRAAGNVRRARKLDRKTRPTDSNNIFDGTRECANFGREADQLFDTSLYGYGIENPLANDDPLGLWPVLCTLHRLSSTPLFEIVVRGLRDRDPLTMMHCGYIGNCFPGLGYKVTARAEVDVPKAPCSQCPDKCYFLGNAKKPSRRGGPVTLYRTTESTAINRGKYVPTIQSKCNGRDIAEGCERRRLRTSRAHRSIGPSQWTESRSALAGRRGAQERVLGDFRSLAPTFDEGCYAEDKTDRDRNRCGSAEAGVVIAGPGFSPGPPPP